MSEMDLHDGSDGEQDRLDGASRSDRPPDAPEADALDQRREVRGHGDPLAPVVPADVDPADRADQERTVELDEDDYR